MRKSRYGLGCVRDPVAVHSSLPTYIQHSCRRNLCVLNRRSSSIASPSLTSSRPHRLRALLVTKYTMRRSPPESHSNSFTKGPYNEEHDITYAQCPHGGPIVALNLPEVCWANPQSVSNYLMRALRISRVLFQKRWPRFGEPRYSDPPFTRHMLYFSQSNHLNQSQLVMSILSTLFEDKIMQANFSHEGGLLRLLTGRIEHMQ